MFKQIVLIKLVDVTETPFSLKPTPGDFKYEFRIKKRYIGVEEHKINKVTKSDLVDKSIFRYPKIKLPRDKVDLLKQSCNLKVTRNSKSADYHVITADMMKKMSNTKYLTDITLNEMKLELAELDHKIATTSLQNQSFLERFKNELVILGS